MSTTVNGVDRSDGVVYTYEEGLVTATDIETGVAGCGESKPAALQSLSEALTLHEGKGEPITDEHAFLSKIGLDPDEIAKARKRNKDKLPEFLR